MNAVRNHRTRNLLITVGVLILIGTVFGLRFKQLGQKTALASIRSVQEVEGIPVETVSVQKSGLAQWITMAGTVEGTVQYPIVSNNALPVVTIAVREGDRVAKGDVIIHLASNAPSPMYHSLDKSRANYQNALLNVQRLRNLYEAGAVSLSELDAAETRLQVLTADLADAEGSILLRATEPGVVSRIMVTEGQMVKTGKPLVWIVDTTEVKVKFSAGSNQALSLTPGLEVVWVTPEGQVRNGQISQLDLMADPETHLLGGEVRFDNSDSRLVPGLLVSFKVRTAERQDALALPVGCLVRRGEQDFVWVVDGIAQLTEVQLGLRTADQVEILTGLDEGQQVVIHGQSLLTDGVQVKIVGAGEGS